MGQNVAVGQFVAGKKYLLTNMVSDHWSPIEMSSGQLKMCLISSKVLPEEMHARLEVRLRRGGLPLQRGLCGWWVGLTILSGIIPRK